MSQNHADKKFYKADEIADILGVKKFVLRTWEKQFNINRVSAQYSEDDLEIFEIIKRLLYEQRLSPNDARSRLPELLMRKALQTEAQSIEDKLAPASSESEAAQTEPSESIHEGVENTMVGATVESQIIAEDQVQPAIKQNEEFWNNIKTFKEQLLKIHEQLK